MFNTIGIFVFRGDFDADHVRARACGNSVNSGSPSRRLGARRGGRTRAGQATPHSGCVRGRPHTRSGARIPSAPLCAASSPRGTRARCRRRPVVCVCVCRASFMWDDEPTMQHMLSDICLIPVRLRPSTCRCQCFCPRRKRQLIRVLFSSHRQSSPCPASATARAALNGRFETCRPICARPRERHPRCVLLCPGRA